MGSPCENVIVLCIYIELKKLDELTSFQVIIAPYQNLQVAKLVYQNDMQKSPCENGIVLCIYIELKKLDWLTSFQVIIAPYQDLQVAKLASIKMICKSCLVKMVLCFVFISNKKNLICLPHFKSSLRLIRIYK